ncbi:MAG: 23S rRNA (adenine(2503)-C(2))-methyltransferase RlmN, partial [Caulobacteraceae bacterium]
MKPASQTGQTSSGPMDIAGLTRVRLQSALSAAGIADGAAARMRASQLWRWVQHHGVTNFSAMTNIAKEVRSTLADHFIAGRPEIVERRESGDGTVKWLLRFAPGVEAETVFIPDVGRFGA